MADVEIKRRIRLSREEAGERLIVLGKALAGGSRSELDFDGDSVRFTVADQLTWEFELEVDGDELELEIELKWSDPGPARAARPAPAEDATPEPEAEPEPAPAAPRTARKRARSTRPA